MFSQQTQWGRHTRVGHSDRPSSWTPTVPPPLHHWLLNTESESDLNARCKWGSWVNSSSVGSDGIIIGYRDCGVMHPTAALYIDFQSLRTLYISLSFAHTDFFFGLKTHSNRRTMPFTVSPWNGERFCWFHARKCMHAHTHTLTHTPLLLDLCAARCHSDRVVVAMNRCLFDWWCYKCCTCCLLCHWSSLSLSHVHFPLPLLSLSSIFTSLLQSPSFGTSSYLGSVLFQTHRA